MKTKCFCRCGQTVKKKFIRGHNIRIKSVRIPNPNKKIITLCRFCKKVIFHYKCNQRTFCSKYCWGKFYGRLGGLTTQKSKNKKNPPLHIGKNHWHWKGGITSQSKRKRCTQEYKNWRLKIYKRDFYTCQKCGHKSTNLHAHHIKSACDYPKLFLQIDNGITLCKRCHGIYHPNLK